MLRIKKIIIVAIGLTILFFFFTSSYILYNEPEKDSYIIETDFLTDDLVMIHGTLYVPRLLPLFLIQNNGTVPGIVLIHGLAGSHYVTESLAKVCNVNGIVALGIDLRGHGLSSGGFDFTNQPWKNFQGNSIELALDVKAAIEFLTKICYFVNSSQIGVYGGSLGGLAAITEGCLVDLTNVTVSMSMAKFDVLYFINSTHPPNLLMILGINDDLFSTEEGYLIYYLACGETLVPPYEEFGDFSNGTARRLILTPNPHEVVPSSPVITWEIVKWFRMAFFNTTSGITISADTSKYGLSFIANISGFFGFFLIISIIPGIASFIISVKRRNYPLALNKVKTEKLEPKSERKTSFLFLPFVLLFVYVISAILIYPVAGFFWWIPAIGGNFLISILLVSTCLGILGIYLYTRKTNDFSLKKLIFDKNKLFSAIIIGIVMFFYILMFTSLSSFEFNLLRAPICSTTILILFLFFLPYLFIDETWSRIFIQSKFEKEGLAKKMLITIPLTAIMKVAFFGLIYLWGLIYGWLGFSFIDDLVLKLMVPTFLAIMTYYVCIYAPFIFNASKKIHASALCCALLLAFDFGMRLPTIIF
ncbi:MAG: alpha/beta hydrolase family protein [Candidatus Helarchaeota archaeon]